jgi:hypothetical protein
MQLQRIWQRLLRLALSQALRVRSTEARQVLRVQMTRALTSSNINDGRSHPNKERILKTIYFEDSFFILWERHTYLH